jgi:hypothetical protein
MDNDLEVQVMLDISPSTIAASNNSMNQARGAAGRARVVPALVMLDVGMQWPGCCPAR